MGRPAGAGTAGPARTSRTGPAAMGRGSRPALVRAAAVVPAGSTDRSSAGPDRVPTVGLPAAIPVAGADRGRGRRDPERQNPGHRSPAGRTGRVGRTGPVDPVRSAALAGRARPVGHRRFRCPVRPERARRAARRERPTRRHAATRRCRPGRVRPTNPAARHRGPGPVPATAAAPAADARGRPARGPIPAGRPDRARLADGWVRSTPAVPARPVAWTMRPARRAGPAVVAAAERQVAVTAGRRPGFPTTAGPAVHRRCSPVPQRVRPRRAGSRRVPAPRPVPVRSAPVRRPAMVPVPVARRPAAGRRAVAGGDGSTARRQPGRTPARGGPDRCPCPGTGPGAEVPDPGVPAPTDPAPGRAAAGTRRAGSQTVRCCGPIRTGRVRAPAGTSGEPPAAGRRPACPRRWRRLPRVSRWSWPQPRLRSPTRRTNPTTVPVGAPRPGGAVPGCVRPAARSGRPAPHPVPRSSVPVRDPARTGRRGSRRAARIRLRRGRRWPDLRPVPRNPTTTARRYAAAAVRRPRPGTADAAVPPDGAGRPGTARRPGSARRPDGARRPGTAASRAPVVLAPDLGPGLGRPLRAGPDSAEPVPAAGSGPTAARAVGSGRRPAAATAAGSDPHRPAADPRRTVADPRRAAATAVPDRLPAGG